MDAAMLPYGTITADEQAAMIAIAVESSHPSDWARYLYGAPAWIAVDVLRSSPGWVTWWEWQAATTTAIFHTVGRVMPELAREATGAVGFLGHRDANGRHVQIYEIEDRRDPRAPWRARARRFRPVWHPPLCANRWVWDTGRVEQLTLLAA